MALRLRAGGYLHDFGEPTVSISRTTLETEGGTPYAERVTWNINGTLRGNTPAIVASKIAGLELAYSRNNIDLVLFDDATGVVFHALYNRLTANGVHIRQRPSYPKGDGVEMVVDRTYQIVVEADFYTNSAGNILKAWQESLSFSGGGPVNDIIETRNTPAIPVTTHRFSAYRVQQSGSAVGLLTYPPRPIFLWPKAVIGRPQITPSGPRWSNGKFTDYGLSWSIEYAAPVPLIGVPTALKTG